MSAGGATWAREGGSRGSSARQSRWWPGHMCNGHGGDCTVAAAPQWLRQAALASATSEQVQGRAGPEAAVAVGALGSSRVAW
jgi:hypothetical protein